jgi:hypothetical protein
MEGSEGVILQAKTELVKVRNLLSLYSATGLADIESELFAFFEKNRCLISSLQCLKNPEADSLAQELQQIKTNFFFNLIIQTNFKNFDF